MGKILSATFRLWVAMLRPAVNALHMKFDFALVAAADFISLSPPGSLVSVSVTRSKWRQDRGAEELSAEHVYAFFSFFEASLRAGALRRPGNLKRKKSRRKANSLRRLSGVGDKRLRSGTIDKSIVEEGDHYGSPLRRPIPKPQIE